MSHSRTLFIGMDVHKDAIAVADVAQVHGAEVMSLGTIGTPQGDLEQRLRKMPSKATHLRFVYEAGPCGSWLSRDRTKKGYDGWVVAPALMPTKPGDRVTTDRRDAVPRARLARSGDLTAVDGPAVGADALRALSRARADALSDGPEAKGRLTGVWLSHDSRDGGRAHGTPAHLRWLSAVGCPTPAPHIVLQEDVRAVHEQTERRQRLEPALHEHVKAWRVPPVVEALQALRGVQLTVAVTMGAEIGDLTRVGNPRALMKCLGLLPSA